MGLDQYWLVKDEPNAPYEEAEYNAFMTHRKLPELEDFMQQKWEGDGEFNCEQITITHEILDELDTAVADKTLDSTASGFFWGVHDDLDYNEIAEASAKARQLLEAGREVFYTSWW